MIVCQNIRVYAINHVPLLCNKYVHFTYMSGCAVGFAVMNIVCVIAEYWRLSYRGFLMTV